MENGLNKSYDLFAVSFAGIIQIRFKGYDLRPC